MTDEMRNYRRGLALYCLAQSSTPLSAGDLAEYMGTLSQSEGHPESCWRGVDGREVIGILKSLVDDGLVAAGGDRRNGRAGRNAPTWSYAEAASRRVQMPPAPELARSVGPGRRAGRGAAVPAPQAEDHPLDAMTRPQLYALLEVHHLYTDEVARFVARIGEINAAARRILVAAGLGAELP